MKRRLLSLNLLPLDRMMLVLVSILSIFFFFNLVGQTATDLLEELRS